MLAAPLVSTVPVEAGGPPYGEAVKRRAVQRFDDARALGAHIGLKEGGEAADIETAVQSLRKRRLIMERDGGFAPEKSRRPLLARYTNDHRLEPMPIAADKPLSRLRGRPGGGPLPRQRERQAKPGKGARHAERPPPNPSRRAGGEHDETPPT